VSSVDKKEPATPPGATTRGSRTYSNSRKHKNKKTNDVAGGILVSKSPDKREVVPGIEPGLPECSEVSESDVIATTLYNRFCFMFVSCSVLHFASGVR
jgi:hypothetical protein